MNYEYCPILRVPATVLISKREKDTFFKCLSTLGNAVKEVVFFTHLSHDLRLIEYMQTMADKLKEYIVQVKEMGYRVGVNVLCTVGHMAEDRNTTLSNLDYMENSGNVNYGRLCATSDNTYDYIDKLYKVFAAMPLDIIYSDDDLNYGLNCDCKICMNTFEEKYGLFSKYSMPVNSESYYNMLNSADIDIRIESRKCFLSFYKYKQEKIFSVIEKAVHGVNPDISLGFMTCTLGNDGCGEKEWAKVLKGKSEKAEVYHRPGGGLWTDFVPSRLMEKVNFTARQIRYLPEEVKKVQAEIEVFPYYSLRKSAKFLELESLMYLASGCTGISFYPTRENDFFEDNKYIKCFKNITDFADELVSIFGRSQPEGIGAFWNKDSFLNISSKIFSPVCNFPDDIFNIGLPVCYNNKCEIFLLNKSNIENMTDKEILLCLKKGVMLDGDALKIINDRGFSKYTGFKISKEFKGNAVEFDLDHRFNFKGNNERNIGYEFLKSGHGEYAFDKPENLYSIEKTAENAEYLTQLFNRSYELLDYASGIFENELGGRVYVGGYAAFTWCYTYSRTIQLKNIVKWLSKDNLKAYVNSFEKIMIFNRKTTENKEGIIFCNVSFDDIKNLEIAIKNNGDKLISRIYENGNVTENEVKPIRKDGVYYVYNISALSSFSVGYIL